MRAKSWVVERLAQHFRFALAALGCVVLAGCASHWPIADRERQAVMMQPEENLGAEYRNVGLHKERLWGVLTKRESQYFDTVRLEVDAKRNRLTAILKTKGKEVDRWSTHYSVVDRHVRLTTQHRLHATKYPPAVGKSTTRLKLARLPNRLVVNSAAKAVGVVMVFLGSAGTGIVEYDFPVAGVEVKLPAAMDR